MRPLFAILLLVGCVTRIPDIDYSIPPPADWPTLQEKVGYVLSTEDLGKYCLGRPPRGALGCALTDFSKGLCWIYLATKDPAVLEHERAHCRGYNHVGDVNHARNNWEQWKKANGK